MRLAQVGEPSDQDIGDETVNQISSGNGRQSFDISTESAEPEIQSEIMDIVDSSVNQLNAFIDLGGPVVALLLLLSVFALTIIILKFWQFYIFQGSSFTQVSTAIKSWQADDYEGALQLLARLRGPLARVVKGVMSNSLKHQDSSLVREETEIAAVTEVNGLRSYLRGLEAVVQVAPLLGLFGTVLGMIEAFRTVESAGSNVNPADLAGGIWVALLTTAVGLAIAMPVSLVLHWFEGKIERTQNAIERLVTQVLTHPPRNPAETDAQMRIVADRERA